MDAFPAGFAKQFIVLNVVTIVIATIVECLSEKSIFKPTTRKQNGTYWNKRVSQIIKSYVYSMPTFVVGAVYAAVWDMEYAEVYCHHPEFHLGRFVIHIAIYLFVVDTVNYWYHRMYHIRTPIDLYQLVHWYHHQFNPLTSYATFAIHPIFALGATLPHYLVAVGMSLIFPFDLVSHQIAGFMVLVFRIISHDGTHHDTANYNFAVGYWTFWDKVGNTYNDSSERRASALRANRIRMQ